MPHPLRGTTAICGLGLTEMGPVYGRSATDLATEAIMLALEDAGMQKQELDGLLINSGVGGGLDLSLASAAGLGELGLLNHMNSWGSTAGVMVEFAAMAVHHGIANTVACVFADAPLKQGKSSGSVYGSPRSRRAGMSTLNRAYGNFGPIPWYAMAAQRHMDLFGTTQDQLGAIAVSTRNWARRSPHATHRKELDLEGYHASRWIMEPFHVLDCCLVSNGGVAVIVTRADRARNLAQPPAYIHGMGQAHNIDPAGLTDSAVHTPAKRGGETAYRMAGATPRDVTCAELYDCYSYTVLASLEDYGFCEKGEGGPFVADGKIAPGGALPTNTGGGQLSGYYMWGMTPISEAVIQVRGQGGERQAPNDLVLVSGNGGLFSHNATLLLSPHAA